MIKLTPRQHEITQYARLGWSDKGIALKLKINPKTVQIHMVAIKRKFKVNNRTQLALLLNGIVVHDEEPRI